jgi:copper(I)-binding protein
MARVIRAGVVPLAVCLLAACGSDRASARPELGIEDPWVRSVVATDEATNTAAYLTIRNTGGAADRLIAARTDVARMTEVHRTTIDSTGLARMNRVEAIDLQPGAEIRLETGSYHLMLMGITRSLAVGDTVRLSRSRPR